METHVIETNSGNPYVVKIKDHHVCVYDNYGCGEKASVCESKKGCTHQKPAYLVYSFDCVKIFHGRSSPYYLATYGRDYDGGTMLFQIGHLKYIYVGETIEEFHPDAPIVEFVSNMDNGTVPAAYSIDANGRFYLHDWGVEVGDIPVPFSKDPYRYALEKDHLQDNEPLCDTYSSGVLQQLKDGPNCEEKTRGELVYSALCPRNKFRFQRMEGKFEIPDKKTSNELFHAGVCYWKGLGCKRDRQKAKQCFSKGALLEEKNSKKLCSIKECVSTFGLHRPTFLFNGHKSRSF